MRLWIIRSVLATWLLVLTGCGAATTSTPAQPSSAVPTAASTAPTIFASAVPTTGGSSDVANQPLVRYGVTGGIRGAEDVLEIYPDRKVKLLRRGQVFRETMVDPVDFATLGVALGSPDFTSLSGDYGDLKACCDMMTYSIEMPAMGHTIRTIDGADQPAALQAVLQQLNNIYIKAQV